MSLRSVLDHRWVHAPATDPTDFSDSLVAWWDASDTATITADSSGWVTKIQDKWRSCHAAPPTTNERPLTGQRSRNGRNGLKLAGDWVEHHSAKPLVGAYTGFTVAQVWEIDSTSTYRTSFGLMDPLNTPQSVYLNGGQTWYTGDSISRIQTGGAGGTTEVGPRIKTGVLYVVILRWDGTTDAGAIKLWVNGQEFTSTIGNGNGLSSTMKSVYLGSSGPAGSGSMDGVWYESALWSRSLSDVETSRLGAYLKNKWAPAWTPLELPNLWGWWDASYSGSITASGGKVSQWNDLSVNFRELTQGTSVNQPSTGADTINSRNVLSFDPSTDIQTLQSATTAASPFSSGFSVIFVFEKTGAATSFDAAVNISSSNAALSLMDAYDGTRAHGSSTDTGWYDLSTTGVHLISWIGRPDSPYTTTEWRNGSQTKTFDFSNYQTGAQRFVVGGRYAGTTSLRGNVAEVIACGGQLSTVDRVAAENYLNSRWAVY